jgi:hypothetical protein
MLKKAAAAVEVGDRKKPAPTRQPVPPGIFRQRVRVYRHGYGNPGKVPYGFTGLTGSRGVAHSDYV